MSSSNWQFKLSDSLEKVYPDVAPRALDESITLSVLKGEPASFQLAFKPPVERDFRAVEGIHLGVTTSRPAAVEISQVDLVPVTLAAFPETTEGYDRVTPGLYPDVLRPVEDGQLQQIYGYWSSAWVEVTSQTAGQLELTLTVSDSEGKELFTHTLTVYVIDAQLPELELVNSHWFHTDGLATFYGVEAFNEDHWEIIDNFLESAAKMRVNSVLTPTWTPPLDTAIGGLRLPTQLIGIHDSETHDAGTDSAATYTFDFSRLLRWIELCKKHGIKTLEIAHLFTQWGAKATPAIYVETAEGLQRRFGWDVEATSSSYKQLMSQLLPQLREVLEKHWGLGNVIFHISDEPHGDEHRASYTAAKNHLGELLDGLRLVDALSDFEFYQQGLVPTPIVASDAVEPFFAAGIQKPWVYYCVAQDRGVANRFISMPSSRNRVLGHQLFVKDCGGFLHWGFNFYNTVHSVKSVNPFVDTCAGGGFPGGDSFMVYPGPEGMPWESIRFKVFAQAMDDHRAFQLLATLRGRDTVLKLLNTDGADGPLEMDRFSTDPLHFRRVRETVNQSIKDALAGR